MCSNMLALETCDVSARQQMNVCLSPQASFAVAPCISWKIAILCIAAQFFTLHAHRHAAHYIATITHPGIVRVSYLAPIDLLHELLLLQAVTIACNFTIMLPHSTATVNFALHALCGLCKAKQAMQVSLAQPCQLHTNSPTGLHQRRTIPSILRQSSLMRRWQACPRGCWTAEAAWVMNQQQPSSACQQPSWESLRVC